MVYVPSRARFPSYHPRCPLFAWFCLIGSEPRSEAQIRHTPFKWPIIQICNDPPFLSSMNQSTLSIYWLDACKFMCPKRSTRQKTRDTHNAALSVAARKYLSSSSRYLCRSSVSRYLSIHSSKEHISV